MKPNSKKGILISLIMIFLMASMSWAAIAPDTKIKSDLQSLFDNPSMVNGFPFQTEMEAAATRYHLPLPYVMAVARGESFFDPKAVSPKGAVGIMQLMPETAAEYGVSKEDLFDAAKNIDVGVHFLADLYGNFKDPYMALGAYYCGATGVGSGDSAIRQDCDEYVRYIHSHLQTILAKAEEPVPAQASDQGQKSRFVLAVFDNFLDAKKFRTFLSGKLPDMQMDLFRREMALSDHSRYQYQILAGYRQEKDKETVCRAVEETTGFSFCQ